MVRQRSWRRINRPTWIRSCCIKTSQLNFAKTNSSLPRTMLQPNNRRMTSSLSSSNSSRPRRQSLPVIFNFSDRDNLRLHLLCLRLSLAMSRSSPTWTKWLKMMVDLSSILRSNFHHPSVIIRITKQPQITINQTQRRQTRSLLASKKVLGRSKRPIFSLFNQIKMMITRGVLICHSRIISAL